LHGPTTSRLQLVERQEQAARDAIEAEKAAAEKAKRERSLREKLRIAGARYARENKEQDADFAKLEQHG